MGPERGAREAGRLAVFLAALLAVGAGYTALAFGMDWRTAAGRIGPGFFPRIVGLGIIVLAAVSLVRSLISAVILQKGETGRVDVSARSRSSRGSPPSEGSPPCEGSAPSSASPPSLGSRTFALTVCAMVVLQAGLTAVLLPLGAVVGPALFLLATLTLLNPGRHVLNVSVSVATPVALYLLFQLILNAGLPAGVVPVM